MLAVCLSSFFAAAAFLHSRALQSSSASAPQKATPHIDPAEAYRLNGHFAEATPNRMGGPVRGRILAGRELRARPQGDAFELPSAVRLLDLHAGGVVAVCHDDDASISAKV